MQEAVERSKDVVLKRVPPRTAEFFAPNPPDVDPADVVSMAQELRVCLKCGGDLIVSNDDAREYVCRECGHVYGQEQADECIPFQNSSADSSHFESNFSPETNMDWGKGLGSKADVSLLATIIGESGDMPEKLRLRLEEECAVKAILDELEGKKKKEMSNQHMPDPLTGNRANHIRVPLAHPLIQKLLTFGSQFCDKYGLHQKRNVNHMLFADTLARNLRRVGRHYAEHTGKMWDDPWRVAAAFFCLLFRETYADRYDAIRGQDAANEKYPELILPDETLDFYRKLLESLWLKNE